MSAQVRYRSRFDIIADVLSVCKNGAKKTWIMYQANLSHKLLSKYLAEVMESGLISLNDTGTYSLTTKGQDFLERHAEYNKAHKGLEEGLVIVNDHERILLNMVGAEPNRRTARRR